MRAYPRGTVCCSFTRFQVHFLPFLRPSARCPSRPLIAKCRSEHQPFRQIPKPLPRGHIVPESLTCNDFQCSFASEAASCLSKLFVAVMLPPAKIALSLLPPLFPISESVQRGSSFMSGRSESGWFKTLQSRELAGDHALDDLLSAVCRRRSPPLPCEEIATEFMTWPAGYPTPAAFI